MRAIPRDSTTVSMLKSENELGRTCVEQNLPVQQNGEGIDWAERKLKSDNKKVKTFISFHYLLKDRAMKIQQGRISFYANLHLEI